MTAPWPWPSPSGGDLSLPTERVDCWAITLDDLPAADANAVALLSAVERARAERFRFEQHRRMYVRAHAALRLLLGRYLQAPPVSIEIVPDRNGRPVLADCERLHFNLSHSGAIALVAVSCIAPVGVDIEELRDISDFVHLAHRCFAPDEVEHVLRLAPADRLRAFFVTWTRKEAYVKALGLGLSFPLDAFSTVRADGSSCLVHAGGKEDPDWSVADLACPGKYRAALAVRHPCVEIECRQATWSWLLDGTHSPALNEARAASTAFGS